MTTIQMGMMEMGRPRGRHKSRPGQGKRTRAAREEQRQLDEIAAEFAILRELEDRRDVIRGIAASLTEGDDQPDQDS
jgi:hypothetical protein